MDYLISVSFGELTLKGDNRKDFENRIIRKIKKAIAVTLKELGSKLGYSIATISNWENLKSAPDLYNVEDVATYFNLPMNIFIGEG